MHVALFVTCLIDHMRPQAAHATIALLQQAGCRVDVPLQQTCCGQPAYNNGDTDDARELARHTIRILEDYDYVVIPSGSCAGMLILHYPQLFDAEPEWHSRALALARNCYELTRFLHEVVEYIPTARCDLRLSYHDSCSCRRELGILEQPRELLRRIDGVELL
ncbi:MAG: (Fe-S)-binding protein, partial [Chromatiales bacterium]|nr:(Fe-S)-binding protein [Chromatiales bacterium]